MSRKKEGRPTFAPEQFTASRYDTANEKATFANGLVRFIAGGFRKTQFTQAVYEGLRLRFGHIAHFNRHGFYDEWFSSNARCARFLGLLDDDLQRRQIGGFAWPESRRAELWGDVVDALAAHEAWFSAALVNQVAIARAKKEAAERSQLRALLAKYGVPQDAPDGRAHKPRIERPPSAPGPGPFPADPRPPTGDAQGQLFSVVDGQECGPATPPSDPPTALDPVRARPAGSDLALP